MHKYFTYPSNNYKQTDKKLLFKFLGITERVEYLKSLDVRAICISPFFESPMVDNGYDISDYKSVDLLFGNIDDFKVGIYTRVLFSISKESLLCPSSDS